ncbi:hypothetical protein [Meiothermus granaticius]|uniref:Uncharacterized protein n=1 Tax=Meiothermus granaticius NBRC 107808 TaxID=1227551 RepID=A0A399F8L5_9DEIN|nr:hypothetical protein [Meiothermus granaticius]MCL6526071.1 hypothetical protein [Thermaceae bacterium]RIH92016.1 hypothetical protein Mgrana_02089 [Meiothermus granaticius NBRC 107808]GEM86877.1 hypothetical protein MGR01S_15020 [Meiothermus granaticius NBRC 107808]
MKRLLLVFLALGLSSLAQTGLTPAYGGSFSLQTKGYDLGKFPDRTRIRIKGQIAKNGSVFGVYMASSPKEGVAPNYNERFLQIELNSAPKAKATYVVGDPAKKGVQGSLSLIDDRKGSKSWGGLGKVTVVALSQNSITLKGENLQMVSSKNGKYTLSFVLKVDNLSRTP